MSTFLTKIAKENARLFGEQGGQKLSPSVPTAFYPEKRLTVSTAWSWR